MIMMITFTWLILLKGAVFIACQSCPHLTTQSCPLMTLENGDVVQSVLKVLKSTVDLGLPPDLKTKAYYCEIPACLSSPCQYGGACEETETGFNCKCLQGYQGDRCEHDEAANCSDPTGVLYRGTLAETINGRTCQKWTSQSPHTHSRTPANYPNTGLGDHNYCRNPYGSSTAWCYTTDTSIRWEYCAVGYRNQNCLKGSFIHSLKLVGGSENEGRIAVTTNSTTYMSVHQENWSRNKSRLVCQYLGYEDAYATVGGDLFNVSTQDSNSKIVAVRCPANAYNITDCWHDEFDDEIVIPRDESIAVVCCSVKLCNKARGFPVGLESGQLPDTAIAASTIYSDTFNALESRLNGPKAWIPLEEDSDPYLEISFESIYVISAIITQGGLACRADADCWVTSYRILTKLNDQLWNKYEDIDTNAPKLFTGNYDPVSSVVHNFQRPMACHKLRVNPRSQYDLPALRLELTGYGPLNDVIAAMNNGELSCSSPLHGEPMGVEDGRIPDSQLTSSSTLTTSTAFTAPDGRLEGGLNANVEAAWIADDSDENKWVKIDLGKICNVTGVITQGRYQLEQWVTSVSVSYSTDDVTWIFALEPECGVGKVYAANYDENTHQTILFPGPVLGRYVRIHPLTWFGSQALRYEVLGIP